MPIKTSAGFFELNNFEAKSVTALTPAAAAAPAAPALTGSTSFGFLEGSGVSASPDFGGDGFLLNGFLNGAEVFWNMVYSVLAMIL